MNQRTVVHSFPRPGRSFIYDESNASCDCFSYCYLSLAVLLFFCGCGLTFMVLKEEPNQISPLSRFWMAGPLFICTSLMVALKVLLYVRRRRFISILIRDMTRDPNHWEQVNNGDQCYPSTSLPSIVSLPPPYDMVAHPIPSPPSYTEAIKPGDTPQMVVDMSLSKRNNICPPTV